MNKGNPIEPDETIAFGNPGFDVAHPRFVYHGCNAVYIDEILRDGLKPRGSAAGNYSGPQASHDELVYLTMTYPGYYALSSDGEPRVAVLEIDLVKLQEQEQHLRPDEDYLVPLIMEQHGVERDSAFNLAKSVLTENRHLWSKSLVGMGTCAWEGEIPPSTFTRYCVIDVAKRPYLARDLLDAVPSPTGHAFAGAYYRRAISWLFEDHEEHPAATRERILATSKEGSIEERPRDGMAQHRRDELDFIESEFQHRAAIQVLQLR